MRTLVTSYPQPDMDGVACAYAYAELLRLCGEDAFAAVYSVPHREAQFVLRNLDVHLPRAEATLRSAVILVDTSSVEDISPEVRPEEVIEIIDHRAVHDAPSFSRAKVQIELVGAAATLIAERFFAQHKTPSRTAAALLLCAIFSNTLNFRSKNTTDRDRAATEKLTPLASLPTEFVHEMFLAKSVIDNVEAAIDEDLVTKRDGERKIGLGQLELVSTRAFVKDRKEELMDALRTIMQRERFDAMVLGCVDIEETVSVFLAPDVQSEKLFAQILGAEFWNNVVIIDKTLLRKEISPLLKEALETNRTTQLPENLHKR